MVRSDKKPGKTKTELYKKLTAQLDHIHRIILILKTDEIQKYDVTFAQLAILIRIWSCNNNITPAELGRDLLRKPNTISLILKRMVRDGLVQKTPDPRQKHSFLLSLTPKAIGILHLEKQGKAMNKLFSKLSGERLTQLAVCLGELDEIANKQLGTLKQKSEYFGGNPDYAE